MARVWCYLCAAARAQENVSEVSRVTFADVKGCNEAKAELEEVVEFLKSPTKFTRLGGRLPKGILLTGPPGTGARASAAQRSKMCLSPWEGSVIGLLTLRQCAFITMC